MQILHRFREQHPAHWGLPRCPSCTAQFRPQSPKQLQCRRCEGRK